MFRVLQYFFSVLYSLNYSNNAECSILGLTGQDDSPSCPLPGSCQMLHDENIGTRTTSLGSHHNKESPTGDRILS